MRKIVIKTKKMKRPKGKNRIISALFVFAILIPVVASAEFPSNQQPYPPDLYSQCFDGIDNDGDGKIDLKDSDCPKCFDGIDNDGDKDIDLADSDCPKPKKSFFNAAAAALLGVNNGSLGGGNIAIGENIGGGTIPVGGNLAIAETSCLGRTSVFPRRIRTESGFVYVVSHTACINLIPVVNNNNFEDDLFNTRRRRIPVGRNIAIGDNVPVGRNIPIGNSVGGDNIAIGNNIPVGAPIPVGENIPVGGTIPIGNSIPVSGGNIAVGDNIPIGKNIGGGVIQIGGSIPIGENIPVGGDVSSGSIPVGGTIPGSGII